MRDPKRHRARLVHDDELELLVRMACRGPRTDVEHEELVKIAGQVRLRQLVRDTYKPQGALL